MARARTHRWRAALGQAPTLAAGTCRYPPSVPLAGDGRTKACGCALSRVMRVLSPSTEPPASADDGSTASTATRALSLSTK